jgi:hypothetical protein
MERNTVTDVIAQTKAVLAALGDYVVGMQLIAPPGHRAALVTGHNSTAPKAGKVRVRFCFSSHPILLFGVVMGVIASPAGHVVRGSIVTH